MTSTNSYVLRYFPTHGVTETIRLLLDFVGAKWAEEHPEWPAKKAEQPFGHLPVLVEKNADGQVAFILSESLVIERYILRKHGLMPADPELAARQEQLRDQLYDTHVAMGYAHHSDGEFKKLAVSRRNEMLESVHRVHGKALRDNGSNGHLFGNKTTYADLALYAFVQHFRAESAKDESAVLTAHFDLEVVPEFEKLVSAVEADPALKEYFGRKESPALA